MKRIEKIGARVVKSWEDAHAQLLQLDADGAWEPPCDYRCEGQIIVDLGDGPARTACPAFRRPGVCMILDRERNLVRTEMRLAGWGNEYIERASWDLCPVRDELIRLDHRKGVMLHGPVGTGKTMTAALLARDRWLTVPYLYVYWPDLVEEIKRDAGREARRTPGLVLDDFGVGGISEYRIGAVDSLFEYRNAHRLPTILTTNLTPEAMRQDVNLARIVDRMRQLMPVRVRLSGSSLRA